MVRVAVSAAVAVAMVAVFSGVAVAERPPAPGSSEKRFTGAVWVQSELSATVTPVNAVTRRAGEPVKVPGFASGIAITPNGKTAYVICAHGVLPINAATARAGKLIKIQPSPAYITVTPNGKTVWVAAGDTIVPISTRTNRVGKPITVARSGDGSPELAITPDSKTVYALDATTVVPVRTATGKVGKAVYAGDPGTSMVFTPSGATGYILGATNTVIPVNVRAGQARKPIAVGPLSANAWAMAITPNGKTIYVANYGNGTVVPISTRTNTPGKPIKVGYEPTFIAITPNGDTAYVATSSGVYPISTATDSVSRPVRVRGFSPNAIAITPMAGRPGSAVSVRPNLAASQVMSATCCRSASQPVSQAS
jgi:YVTN family beta-propeller protein